jgi:putative transposase
MVQPDGPNQRWSLELGAARPSPLCFETVSDSLICGRRLMLRIACAPRILCMVDDYIRECLALVAEPSLSSAGVARELTSLMGSRGIHPVKAAA